MQRDALDPRRVARELAGCLPRIEIPDATREVRSAADPNETA